MKTETKKNIFLAANCFEKDSFESDKGLVTIDPTELYGFLNDRLSKEEWATLLIHTVKYLLDNKSINSVVLILDGKGMDFLYEELKETGHNIFIAVPLEYESSLVKDYLISKGVIYTDSDFDTWNSSILGYVLNNQSVTGSMTQKPTSIDWVFD